MSQQQNCSLFKYRIVLCLNSKKKKKKRKIQFGFGKQMEHLASQCLVKINCQFLITNTIKPVNTMTIHKREKRK